MSDTPVELVVIVDDSDDLRDALTAAQTTPGVKAEVQTKDAGTGGVSEQIEPISAILIGAGILAAAKFIVSLVERWRGGLVIDQRKGAANEIRRDPAVPHQWVLVFPPDGGVVKVDTKDEPKDAVERWISSVIEGVFKTASSAASAAKESLSKDKVETEDAAPA